MANRKLTKNESIVQSLMNDSDALREIVQREVQKAVNDEFEAHMGRDRYERDKGRSTHRNGFKSRTLTTRVGKIYLRVPQARDGSFSPSVYERYQRVQKALYLALVGDLQDGSSHP